MELNINFKKVAIGCAIVFWFGVLFGFVGFPKIIKTLIKSQFNLKEGSQLREMWSKAPFALHFYVYVFNITNPEEYANGGKLKVQQIGPYYFDEWKDKYDLVDDPVEDTVEFNMRNTFIFRPDLSNGLTGEETITIPHPLVQAISVAVQRERAPMLDIVSKGVSMIFHEKKPYLTGSFLDIFFRGILVDCSSEEFESLAICTAFHTGEVKGSVKYNETHFLFSLMSGSNHSDAGRFKVCRGVHNVMKIGKVLVVNDEEELDVWTGNPCNQFQGTDTTIFPPFLEKEDGLWAYTPDLCLSLGAFFQKKTKYESFPVSRFEYYFGDLGADPNTQCYCGPNVPQDCPPVGTMNLAPCLGGPLSVSMPHFYKGEKSLFDNIEGLSPNEEDHGIYIDFDLFTGTPFNAAKRLQFNIDSEPVPKVEAMAKVRKLILPLFWVEEGVALNKTWTSMVKPLFVILSVNKALKWICTILGGIGFAAAMVAHFSKSEGFSVTNTRTGPITVDRVDNRNPIENGLGSPVVHENGDTQEKF